MWDDLANMPNITMDPQAVFTYADTCYSPSGVTDLSADLIRHEETHSEQQYHDTTHARVWWQRWIMDPEWRVEQEAEAYAEQYKFLCGRHKDRNVRAQYLHGLATQLAGPMYGNAIKHRDAMKKIKSYALGQHIATIEDEIE